MTSAKTVARRVSRRARGLRLFVCLGVLTLSGATPARADRLDDAWKQGNDAFLKGDYAHAIAAYEQLDRQQVAAPDLTFNLGNAYFRSGQLGPAIWAWERTLTAEPDHEDARFNLTQARNRAARRIEDKVEGANHEPAWIRLVNLLAPATETWLFVIVYLAFFASVALLLRARRSESPADQAPADGHHHIQQGTVWGVAAGVLGFCALAAGALLAGRFVLDRVPFAIILPDAVAVKEGADANYRTTFEVHAGLRVRILDRDQDWARVRLANGLEGWVPDRSVGRL